MFVLKDCNVLELSEVNSHAAVSHSKQRFKNIHPMMLAAFCFVHWQKSFAVATLENLQNDRLYTHPSSINQEGRRHDKTHAHN